MGLFSNQSKVVTKIKNFEIKLKGNGRYIKNIIRRKAKFELKQ